MAGEDVDGGPVSDAEGGHAAGGAPAERPVSSLTFAEAGDELDGIVARFEQGEVDVDELVAQLKRATAIVDELDRRIRATRAEVDELVPRLSALAEGRAAGDERGAGAGVGTSEPEPGS